LRRTRGRAMGERQCMLAPDIAMMLREHSGEAIGPRLGSIPA